MGWFDKQCYLPRYIGQHIFSQLSTDLLFIHGSYIFFNLRLFFFSAFISIVYHCDDGLNAFPKERILLDNS